LESGLLCYVTAAMPDAAPSPETFFKAFGLLSHLYLTPVLRAPEECRVSEPARPVAEKRGHGGVGEHGEHLLNSAAELGYSVKTGKSSFEHVYAESFWDRMRRLPDEYEMFNRLR